MIKEKYALNSLKIFPILIGISFWCWVPHNKLPFASQEYRLFYIYCYRLKCRFGENLFNIILEFTISSLTFSSGPTNNRWRICISITIDNSISSLHNWSINWFYSPTRRNYKSKQNYIKNFFYKFNKTVVLKIEIRKKNLKYIKNNVIKFN